jgi:hypothetical protein
MMETNGIGLPMLPAVPGDPGAGLGIKIEEAGKNREILGPRLDLATDGAESLHERIIPRACARVGHNIRRTAALLHRRKAVVSALSLERL